MLRLAGLTKRYEGRTIINGLDYEFSYGNVVVVTGANGSGKSTLLKIVSGLLNPTRGTVTWTIDGIDYAPRDAMRLLGYVSPEAGLYDRLTAAEHVSFFASLRRIKHDDKWVEAILAKVQLAEYKHLPVGQFSSGMKQRMKLACSLLHKPPALILDEPSTNLDSYGHELLENIVAEQACRGLVIIATNEEREVTKFGQRLLHLGQCPRAN